MNWSIKGDTLRIIIISDTHNKRIELPPADLLICCGDHSSMGYARELVAFDKWMEEIKPNYKHGILLVPGNHDWLYQREPGVAKALVPSVKVLIHEAIEIEGIKFFGSPWQPIFGNWAFGLSNKELAEKWAQVPDDTQVLISHAPPYLILDQLDEHGSDPGANVGDVSLALRIKELRDLKLSCFGHIHCAANVLEQNGVTFINAAICDEYYKPTQPWREYVFNQT